MKIDKNVPLPKIDKSVPVPREPQWAPELLKKMEVGDSVLIDTRSLVNSMHHSAKVLGMRIRSKGENGKVRVWRV